jgi:hypothetical protein
MTDPVAVAARAAAARLAAEHGPGVIAEVDAAMHARRRAERPEQFVDLLSLGTFIVAVATLAWMIYADLRQSHRQRRWSGRSSQSCTSRAAPTGRTRSGSRRSRLPRQYGPLAWMSDSQDGVYVHLTRTIADAPVTEQENVPAVNDQSPSMSTPAGSAGSGAVTSQE